MGNEFYTIISTDGVKGKAIENEELYCEIEDCNGTQYVVEWEDGTSTIVCGRGLKWLDNETAQIMS